MSSILLTACSGTTPIKTVSDPVKSVSEKEKPQPDLQKIAYAERIGAELNKAMHSADATDPYTSREADLLRMLKDLRCEGNYKAVSVYDTKGQTENIYLILDRQDGFQIGRHMRFRFKLGTNDLIDIEASSKTCLFIPISNDGIPYATHLMSNEPTEFHVFLSRYHNKPIYVGTASGVWEVTGGKINRVEK